MNCLMGVVTNADCVLGIEKNVEIAVVNVGEGYGVEVMDNNSSANFSLRDAKVASKVSDNYVPSEVQPVFVLGVEGLVQISVVAECLFSDFTAELEVAVSFLEGGEGDELRI